MRRRTALDFQKIEDRLCLTVAAGLTDGGALWVHGDADGPVEIVASGEQTFDVIDAGQNVATVENVETNILVRIDQGRDTSADNRLRIDLGDQSVDNVLVRLGNGNNNFSITGDEPVDRVLYHGGNGADQTLVDVDTEFMVEMLMRAGDDSFLQTGDANRVRFHGGEGNDRLRLDADATVRFLGAGMGHGNNGVNIEGDVEQRLHVRGGENSDHVNIDSQADIGGLATINLGHGNNRMSVAGTIDGSLLVRGGNGMDDIRLTEDAHVGRNLGVVLGAGENHLRLAGAVGDNVYYRGFGGDDSLRIGETGEIGGSVRVLLGAGDNGFHHAGQIDGNLIVLSKNASDQFVVSGNVDGRIFLGPGDQGGGGS